MLTLATKFRPDEPRAFDTANRAGLAGVEFWLNKSLLLRWNDVVTLARKHPFRYALHFPNHGSLDSDALQGAARLYEELQCRAMVIHRPMYERYAERLLSIAPSMRLAVENHELDVPAFNLWAAANRWLTLDVEHVWLCTLPGAPPKDVLDFVDQFLSRHVGRLCHVHMTGYRPGRKEHRPIHYAADIATAVFGLLAAHGYSELAVSEADAEYQNLEELRHDAALFDTWQRGVLGSHRHTA
jgi:sugar phosphate isomerase/epimerase